MSRTVPALDGVSCATEVWFRAADGTGIAQKVGPASHSTGVGLHHWQPLCKRKGDNNANTLTGTAKSELICGFGGIDTIDGKGGLDIVFAGGKGNDRLDGGKGTDRCVQGPGTGALISC